MNPEIRCHVCGAPELVSNANPHKQVVFCAFCAGVARYFSGVNFASFDLEEKEQHLAAMLEAEIPRATIPRLFWHGQHEEIEALLNQIK